MSVTREQVEEVARLARLRLTPAEAERFTAELNGILAHVQALSAATDGIEPLESAAQTGAALRADVAGADPLHVSASELAAEWAAGFFTVPRLSALGGDPDGDDA